MTTDREYWGHEIEHRADVTPYGSVHTYRCTDDGCFIEARGEHGARDRIEELAGKYPCPSGTTRCATCGADIPPDADLCRACHRSVTVSPRVGGDR